MKLKGTSTQERKSNMDYDTEIEKWYRPENFEPLNETEKE